MPTATVLVGKRFREEIIMYVHISKLPNHLQDLVKADDSGDWVKADISEGDLYSGMHSGLGDDVVIIGVGQQYFYMLKEAEEVEADPEWKVFAARVLSPETVAVLDREGLLILED